MNAPAAGRRGRFITLEGGEGAGKSTQARLIADWLRAAGIEVVTTREPGGSPGAEAIRHVLLSGAAQPFGQEAEAVLFAAARADHVDRVIAPALARGAWVVCDRFIDSTRVYQGMVGQVPMALLHRLEHVAIGAVVPDLTLVLDVPVELGQARVEQRRGAGAADRFETEGPAFHKALRAGFRALAAREPQRIVLVDASAAPDIVHGRIRAVIEDRLAGAVPKTDGAAA
jgi:dTMP kinase